MEISVDRDDFEIIDADDFTPDENNKIRTCPRCSALVQGRRNKIYCSPNCRKRHKEIKRNSLTSVSKRRENREFFEKAMSNKTITLHNGENKVDFTYRQDAARGIILAALSSVANVSFNITAGNATSLRTLAEKIIEITGSDSDIEDIGNHKLYPMRGTLDISRAKDLLDYAPEFTLEQGLKSYYDWLQNKI